MRLHVLDLRQLTLSQWENCMETLPAERRQKAQSCRRTEERVRLIGGGWLLQHALQKAGIREEKQLFCQNEYGKPELSGQQVQFSLSHGGNWAVCAVGATAVGVDVELPRCSLAVAGRWFPEEEVDRVRNLLPEEQKWELCRLWTAREAFLKALGCGLTVPMNSFGVELSAEGAQLQQKLTQQKFLLHEYLLPDSRICLCTTEPRPELEYVKI